MTHHGPQNFEELARLPPRDRTQAINHLGHAAVRQYIGRLTNRKQGYVPDTNRLQSDGRLETWGDLYTGYELVSTCSSNSLRTQEQVKCEFHIPLTNNGTGYLIKDQWKKGYVENENSLDDDRRLLIMAFQYCVRRQKKQLQRKPKPKGRGHDSRGGGSSHSSSGVTTGVR